MMDADDVKAAILAWPGLYETEQGRWLKGSPVSEVPTRLREARWAGVSRLDEYDLRKMGLEIVTARYIGGARPKRFCRVVVAAPYVAQCDQHVKDYRLEMEPVGGET